MGVQLKLHIPKNTEFYDQVPPAPTKEKLYKFFITQSGGWVVYTQDISYVHSGRMIRNKKMLSIKRECLPDEVETIKKDARWELCSEMGLDINKIIANEPMLPMRHNQWFKGIHNITDKTLTFINYI